jgi:membrane fusion protein
MDLLQASSAPKNEDSAASCPNQSTSQVPAHEVPLFRPEAERQQRDQLYGEIILLRPIAVSFLLWLMLGFSIVAIAFLMVGHYARKAHLSGLLLPDQGLIKLYAPIGGTLLTCRVHEGQQVQKGDILLEVSADRSSAAVGSTETEIHNELLSRRQSLIQQRTDTLKLAAQQQAFLGERAEKIEQQERQLVLETAAAQRKLALAERMVDRYRQLRSADLISALQLEEKEEEPLEQQKTLEELQRSQVALESEHSDLQAQLQKVPLETRIQIAAVERSLSEIEGQLIEHEVSRAAVVRAPADGTVSAIVDKTGIAVQPNTALATLVPNQAKLQAHVYGPSRAVGFVKPGDQVVLRYAAYPSEKFGYHQGSVLQVSQAALSPAEYTFRTGATVQEPMYEITVSIPSQVVILYGLPHNLQAGMSVDADILLDDRRLIEWIFEPILSLRGRLAG